MHLARLGLVVLGRPFDRELGRTGVAVLHQPARLLGTRPLADLRLGAARRGADRAGVRFALRAAGLRAAGFDPLRLTARFVRMLSSAASTMRRLFTASSIWLVRSRSSWIAFRKKRCSRLQSSWWSGSSARLIHSSLREKLLLASMAA